MEDFIYTLFKYVVIYPILIFLFWEVFVAQFFGVSLYTILGITIGSKWAVKNFAPKQIPAATKTKRKPRSTDKVDNNLFYEDA